MNRKQKEEAPPPVTVREFYSDREKILNIEAEETLFGLTGCNRLKNAQKLIVRNCPNVYSFAGSERLEKVKYIDVTGTPVRNTDALANYRKLEVFIARNASIENIDALGKNFALRILDLTGNQIRRLEDLSVIGSFKCLKEFSIALNPVEKVEGFEARLLDLLPTCLEKFNGQPLNAELAEALKEKRQGISGALQDSSSKGNKEEQNQKRFLTEIMQFETENADNIQYIGYISKEVNYLSSIEGVISNITKEMLDMQPDELLMQLKQSSLIINGERLYLQDFDGRNTYKFINKANFFVQIATLFTSTLMCREILVVGELSKQKAVNTYELQTRLINLYEQSNQLSFGSRNIEFRRKQNDYRVHVLIFVREIDKNDNIELIKLHPLSRVQEFAKLQIRLRELGYNTSFDLVCQEYSDDFLEINAFDECNFMNELDAEVIQCFEFEGDFQAHIIVDGEVAASTGVFDEVVQQLTEICHISEELELDSKDVFEAKQVEQEDSKDYTYEYEYDYDESEEQELLEPEGKAAEEHEERQEASQREEEKETAGQDDPKYAYAD